MRFIFHKEFGLSFCNMSLFAASDCLVHTGPSFQNLQPWFSFWSRPVITSTQECWHNLGAVYKIILYSINNVVQIYVYIYIYIYIYIYHKPWHQTQLSSGRVYKNAFLVTVYTNYCLNTCNTTVYFTYTVPCIVTLY